jgi:hypothetical protein
MRRNCVLAVGGACVALLMGSTAWGQDEVQTSHEKDIEVTRDVEPDGSVVTTEVVTTTDTFEKPWTPFGAAGQITFGISRIGGINYTKTTMEDASGNALPIDQPNEFAITLFTGGPKNNTNLGLSMPRLSLDIFAADNFSIGGGPIFGYKSDGNQTHVDPAIVAANETTKTVISQASGIPFNHDTFTNVTVREIIIGAELRFGYTFHLGDRFVVWPRAGMEFAWDVVKTTGLMLDVQEAQQGQLNYTSFTQEQRAILAWVELEVPFVFLITESFYMSFTPTFDIPIVGNRTDADGKDVGKVKALNLAGYFSWGGYFHLSDL